VSGIVFFVTVFRSGLNKKILKRFQSSKSGCYPVISVVQLFWFS